MHRGNNRQDIFETEEDMARIKEGIAHALSKYDCRLHAYVIMSNHLYLLITSADKVQLSRFLNCSHNKTYQRSFFCLATSTVSRSITMSTDDKPLLFHREFRDSESKKSNWALSVILVRVLCHGSSFQQGV